MRTAIIKRRKAEKMNQKATVSREQERILADNDCNKTDKINYRQSPLRTVFSYVALQLHKKRFLENTFNS